MIFIRTTASTTVLLLLLAAAAQAQTKVANYAYGEPGTVQYEHLSFWTKDGRRTEISYTYGKSRTEAKLTYVGLDKVSGQPAFKVRFANQHMLYVVPSGQILRVTDSKSSNPKTYTWEYEGPVNGIGTFCQPCAEDEKDAMRLVVNCYLK